MGLCRSLEREREMCCERDREREGKRVARETEQIEGGERERGSKRESKKKTDSQRD